MDGAIHGLTIGLSNELSHKAITPYLGVMAGDFQPQLYKSRSGPFEASLAKAPEAPSS